MSYEIRFVFVPTVKKMKPDKNDMDEYVILPSKGKELINEIKKAIKNLQNS